MIIKNTPKGRRLVKQLSDYLHEATPYFRAMVDKGWNCGEDIRFEIASWAMTARSLSALHTPRQAVSGSRCACSQIRLKTPWGLYGSVTDWRTVKRYSFT